MYEFDPIDAYLSFSDVADPARVEQIIGGEGAAWYVQQTFK